MGTTCRGEDTASPHRMSQTTVRVYKTRVTDSVGLVTYNPLVSQYSSYCGEQTLALIAGPSHHCAPVPKVMETGNARGWHLLEVAPHVLDGLAALRRGCGADALQALIDCETVLFACVGKHPVRIPWRGVALDWHSFLKKNYIAE